MADPGVPVSEKKLSVGSAVTVAIELIARRPCG
jgi:hypothetical protein